MLDLQYLSPAFLHGKPYKSPRTSPNDSPESSKKPSPSTSSQDLASPPLAGGNPRRTLALPPACQNWAHCTVTHDKLVKALTDPTITSVEADILMSVVPSPLSPGTPIMAHPPSRESDLPFSDFLSRCFDPAYVPKHIKLDFKEIEAVEPCLSILNAKLKSLPHYRGLSSRAVFVNADVLPGPGRRGTPATVDADRFVQACLAYDPVPFFSLSWTAHVARVYNSDGYYTPSDIDAMIALCEKYDLQRKAPGIVFAVSARIVARHPHTLADLLRRMPNTQLLLWTGTGEPALMEGYHIAYIVKYFTEAGLVDRVGFDCMMSKTFTDGLINEAMMVTVNILNRLRGVGIDWKERGRIAGL